MRSRARRGEAAGPRGRGDTVLRGPHLPAPPSARPSRSDPATAARSCVLSYHGNPRFRPPHRKWQREGEAGGGAFPPAGPSPRYGGREGSACGGGEAKRSEADRNGAGKRGVAVGTMLEAAAAAEPELDPEDLVHFSVGDLPSRGYGVMGEIRRQGKLCDVTLKVRAWGAPSGG